jgi:hypothetical protein
MDETRNEPIRSFVGGTTMSRPGRSPVGLDPAADRDQAIDSVPGLDNTVRNCGSAASLSAFTDASPPFADFPSTAPPESS